MPADCEYLVAGRYRLLEPLGVGSTAEVYRALDTRLDVQVAVKVLTGTAEVSDPRRFAGEIRMLAGLSHPNLVTAYDAGTDRGVPFVVLNLVEGRTLRERIKQGPLPVAAVRRLGAVLADVLAYVHRLEVVHRDVKPSNILVDDLGHPHLTDFGLALLPDGTRVTRTGQMVGTAAYLSPEQVRGADVGVAADVYALGLVLLECLTGHREYPGGEVEAAVARLHRPPHLPDDLPADLVRLLSLMTALTPRRRPTAAACATALRGPEPTAFLPRRRVRGRPLAAVGATLLAAIGTTLALVGGTPTTSAPTPSPPAPTTTPPTAPAVPLPAANTAETGIDQPVRQVSDSPDSERPPNTPAGRPAPAENPGAGGSGPSNDSGRDRHPHKPAKPSKAKDKQVCAHVRSGADADLLGDAGPAVRVQDDRQVAARQGDTGVCRETWRSARPG